MMHSQARLLYIEWYWLTQIHSGLNTGLFETRVELVFSVVKFSNLSNVICTEGHSTRGVVSAFWVCLFGFSLILNKLIMLFPVHMVGFPDCSSPEFSEQDHNEWWHYECIFNLFFEWWGDLFMMTLNLMGVYSVYISITQRGARSFSAFEIISIIFKWSLHWNCCLCYSHTFSY